MPAPLLTTAVSHSTPAVVRVCRLMSLVGAAVCVAVPAAAQQTPARPAARAAAQTSPPAPAAVVRASNAVVTIVAYRDGSSEVTTGVGVRTGDARIITALRHLRGASRAEVFDEGGDPIGTVTTLEQGDTKLDLGVLRVTGRSDSLTVARRSAVLRQAVSVLGPRRGTTRSIAARTVTHVEPDDAGRALLRIGAPVATGSAGAPVVNVRGELVGVALGTVPGRDEDDLVVDVTAVRELLGRPILRLAMPARDGSLSAAASLAAGPATASPTPRTAGDPARAAAGSVFPERYGPLVGADTARKWVVELFGCSRIESRQKIYCYLRVTNLSTASTFGVSGADLTDAERRKLRTADNLMSGETVQRVAGWRKKAEVQVRELDSVRLALEFALPDKNADQVRLMVDVAGERALWFGPVGVQRVP